MGDTQSREVANLPKGPKPLLKEEPVRQLATKELEHAMQRKQFYEKTRFHRRFFKRGLGQAKNAIRAYKWAQSSGDAWVSVRAGPFSVVEVERLVKTAKYADQKVIFMNRKKRDWTRQSEVRISQVKQWLQGDPKTKQHNTSRLAILLRHSENKMLPQKRPTAHLMTIVLDKTARSIEFYDPNGTPNYALGKRNLYTPAASRVWNAVHFPLESLNQVIDQYWKDEEFGTRRLPRYIGFYHVSTLLTLRRIVEVVNAVDDANEEEEAQEPWELIVQSAFRQHRGWCSVYSMLYAHLRGLGIDRDDALRLANDKREQMQLIAFLKGNPKHGTQALNWASTTPDRTFWYS